MKSSAEMFMEIVSSPLSDEQMEIIKEYLGDVGVDDTDLKAGLETLSNRNLMNLYSELFMEEEVVQDEW